MFVIQGMTYVDECNNVRKLNILDTEDGITELVDINQLNSQIKKEIKFGKYIKATNSYPLILSSINIPGLLRKDGFDILDVISEVPIDNTLVLSRLNDCSFTLGKVGETIGSVFKCNIEQLVSGSRSAQTFLTMDDSDIGRVYHYNWKIYNKNYDYNRPSFHIRLGVLEFSKLNKDLYQVYIVVYDKVTNIVVEIGQLQIDTDKDLVIIENYDGEVLPLHTIKFLQKSLSGLI